MPSVLNLIPPASTINDEKSVFNNGNAADIFSFQPTPPQKQGYVSVAVCGELLQ